jgi:hypothetical protein
MMNGGSTPLMASLQAEGISFNVHVMTGCEFSF